MANISGLSSTTDAYSIKTYTAEKNDKNTLNIQSYFKLMASQLAHQDMTSPMSNSEILGQMSQMAMIQSLAAVNTSMEKQMTMSQQSYGISMIGKNVMVSVPADEEKGIEAVTKSGLVESVSFSGKELSLRLSGDPTNYKLTDVISVGGNSSAQTPEKAAKETDQV
jgi:flagellar basal-body rod modification protein FlgD